MSTKYCDHGGYTSAAFTAYFSGTSMYVTAVASGQVCIGATVTGAVGLTANTYITGNGTGTGLTGTYTVNNNQSRASGTCTTEDGVPQNIPLWGVAQEGDGTLKTLAVPAIVSIDLSAATAAAGAAISIQGAVLTCVASGAGGNQFNAGSGATLVANIVAAINLASNAITAQATGWANPQLRDAVFARAAGSTLQIMTRGGSSVFNASTVTTSGFGGGTFGPYTFSGGVGGCWAYMEAVNYTCWPSGIPNGQYGILAGLAPYAGLILPGDLIEVRGGGHIRYYTGLPIESYIVKTYGTRLKPVTYRIDDGTVWTQDAANLPFIKTSFWPIYAGTLARVPNYSRLIGKRVGDDAYTLQFISTTQATAGLGVGVSLGAELSGFLLESTYAPCGVGLSVWQGSPDGARGIRAKISKFRIINALSNAFVSVYGNQAIDADDGILDNAGSIVVNSNVINNYGNTAMVFKNIRFLNFITGSQLLPTSIYWPDSTCRVSFDNCNFGGVTRRGPYVSIRFTNSYGALDSWLSSNVTVVNRDSWREFSLDTVQGLIAWNKDAGQPLCKAVLDDGIHGYSIMVAPTYYDFISLNTPIILPRIGKMNTLADGDRTFTVELVAPYSLTALDSEVSMKVIYEAVDGTIVTVDTQNYINPQSLTASTATWTNEVDGYVTYQNGGSIQHRKYKLVASTVAGKPLKTATEVSIWPALGKMATNSTDTYFFDPDISIQ